MGSSFVERLKNSTAVSHAELEVLPISVSLIKPDLNQGNYVRYLTLMYDVVKDAEENIFPQLITYVHDIQSRKKSHFIESDLKMLGHPALEHSTPLSDACSNITISFAMGILYVLEGAALGGRVILKNVTEALGFTESNGASYFSGYGNLTGLRWKSFLEMLSNFEETTGQSEEIIKGANFAFKTIQKHFSGE